jgi:hypothetical protein
MQSFAVGNDFLPCCGALLTSEFVRYSFLPSTSYLSGVMWSVPGEKEGRPGMESILLIGEDCALLNGRAEALEITGANVTCCSAAELDHHLWTETYDLVVLCNTLKPGVERSLIVAEVYRRWPQARVLQVVVGSEKLPAAPGVDATLVMGDLGEYGELVEVSMELLGKSRRHKWRPISNRFAKLPLAS